MVIQPTHPTPSSLAQLLKATQQRASQQSLSADDQRQIVQVLSAILEGAAKEIARPLPGLDMQEIRGQEHVKRALEVASAGGHNLLLVGPLGAGKRLLARTLLSVLPEKTDLIPFRTPQTSIDLAAFVGRFDPLSLGELTLAHEGLLFLEHLSAFAPAHLEALQQAVERQVVTPQGAKHAFFPARFLLVATIQPCPCGFYGDPIRECSCLAEDIIQYQQRVKEVTASCFDLHVEVPYVKPNALLDKRPGENSLSIRRRVEAARERQHCRFAGTHLSVNSDLGSIDEVQRYCQLGDSSAEKLLNAAVQQMHLSAQQLLRIQKVSRSIADLAQCDSIAAFHLAEAIQYRGRFGR